MGRVATPGTWVWEAKDRREGRWNWKQSKPVCNIYLPTVAFSEETGCLGTVHGLAAGVPLCLFVTIMYNASD